MYFTDEKDYIMRMIKEMVKDVLLKRTGQRLSKWDFFSEKYYYGDYTKMNMYLVNRYQIPTTLDPNISNPGIKEVDYEDVKTATIIKTALGKKTETELGNSMTA